MSVRGPVRVADRHRFDTLIDARSPAEFVLDHLPGAINCPVLDDAERAIVGTLYKQQGAFEARRVGGAMVAARLAGHLRERLADRPANWRPLVYCWRGGLRSGSMVTWLRLVGWDAQQLAGGYKSWRRHVIDTIEARAPALDLRVVCGVTGSGKTRLLQELAGQGAQVLDLEGLARHKGSLLGDLPGEAQPSQTAFETGLADAIERLDPERPVFVEAESRRIGRVALPTPLLERMRAAPLLEVQASVAARCEFLLRDYAYLGADGEALALRLAALTDLHGHAVIGRWQAWARAGELAPLFTELMTRHYDPHYRRSQAGNYRAWETRQPLEVADLLPQTLQRLARSMVTAG
jgi:tRNA 2-selenouridine synthase